MKVVAICIVLIIAAIDPVKIGKINTLKAEARRAYTTGDYKLAIQKYRYLTDSLEVTEDEVMLNLANAYFLSMDTTNASATFESLSGSPKPRVRSRAQQQLGILNHQQGKFDEALQNFKQAIKADAENIDARRNYEMLKKKLDEQKKKDEEDKKNKEKPKDPSEFAKKLKAQADRLAAQFKFKEAQNLMLDGAKKDPSVMHYSDFIERLKNVVTIDKK
ncbi:MAG: hypothetical protein WKF87_13710 [Chryseolinea sp.]